MIKTILFIFVGIPCIYFLGILCLGFAWEATGEKSEVLETIFDIYCIPGNYVLNLVRNLLE